jgi:signal transduction histidine kinase
MGVIDRLRGWLLAVPGRDAVERRQAYLLELALLVLCAVFAIAGVLNGLSGALRPGATTSAVLPNLETAGITVLLLAVLRRGFFRVIAALTVSLLILGFANSLANGPTELSGSYLALLMVPIVLAGLILPRLGLALVTAGVILFGALGLRTAAARAGIGIDAGTGDFLFAALLIAAVVDQFGGTVRAALLHAIAREEQLETAREQLQARTTELQTAVGALESEMAERQRVEAERRAMETRVLEVQKLESLGILAGGIAHDFNNLLVGIMGNAGLALLDLPPESPARESLEQIETAARRAADLAREMLAYSGKGRFIVEPLDLSELLREMTHLLRVSIGRSVVIKYALASGPLVVEGDATQLRQVVMNLVVNASDAIGDASGVITVGTGRRKADRSYLASTYLDEGLHGGEYAFIEVSDTGAGMDEETQARIFDPFFTTKFAGRGLGLAAVLGIVRGHHGALKVYSEPGHGSTFKLLLPLASSSVHVPTPDDGGRGWRSTARILVVDDEPSVRAIAERILQRFGMRVTIAEDGIAGGRGVYIVARLVRSRPARSDHAQTEWRRDLPPDPRDPTDRTGRAHERLQRGGGEWPVRR